MGDREMGITWFVQNFWFGLRCAVSMGVGGGCCVRACMRGCLDCGWMRSVRCGEIYGCDAWRRILILQE